MVENYPEHTVNFVRLVLLVTMCDVLSNTLINLQTATGKIRNYQIAVGGMLLMNFPFSYLCLKVGFPPESVLIIALIVAICCLLLRLLFLRKMVGLPVRRYLYKVCGNVVVVTFVALLLPFLFMWQMPDGFLRFFVVSLLSVMCALCSVYWIGCTSNERDFIRAKVLVILKNKYAYIHR